MFEASQSLLLPLAAAFMLGWAAGQLTFMYSTRKRRNQPDPRDHRIRSLEAEHRVAKVDSGTVRLELEEIKRDLAEEKKCRTERDKALQDQADMIDSLRQDLKESVIKTRELRAELTERAEQDVRAQLKLREVETELSVVHAANDLITTGVLDYSLAPEKPNPETKSKPKPSRRRISSVKRGS